MGTLCLRIGLILARFFFFFFPPFVFITPANELSPKTRYCTGVCIIYIYIIVFIHVSRDSAASCRRVGPSAAALVVTENGRRRVF